MAETFSSALFSYARQKIEPAEQGGHDQEK
jgi:hypothetical protein